MDTFEWYCKNDSPHYKQNNNQLQCSVKTVRLFYLMGGGGVENGLGGAGPKKVENH